MTTEEIDRILASEALLEPSAGFASAVLEGVRQQAADPPLPFPWGRFLGGVAACTIAAASGTVLLVRHTAVILDAFGPLAGAAPELGWAALGLVVAFGATRLPKFVRLWAGSPS